MQSAKSILINNSLKSDTPQPKKRGATIEFQGYAYKLASDLNDLENLRIYMMLSKKVERQLMEQAFSYVADSKAEEKGKLFLWKLKKIREEVERLRNKKNFTYDYVIARQKEFKKVFASEIVLKQDSELSDEIIDNLKKYLLRNRKVLVLGNTSRRVYKVIENAKPKATVVELSPELNKINNSINAKVINKDFLKNIYKDSTFDIILLNNFWSQIPTEAEIKYLKEVKRLAKKNAMFIALYKCGTKCDEAWKEFDYRKKIYMGYFKSFTKENLFEQFEKFELKLEKEYKVDGYYLSVFLNNQEV